MNFSGPLEDLQVRELLKILASSASSGLLKLFCDKERAEVRLSKGRVVAVLRQGPDAPSAQNSNLSQAVSDPVSRRALIDAVRNLFCWNRGCFSFQPEATATGPFGIFGVDEFGFDQGVSAEVILEQENVCLPVISPAASSPQSNVELSETPPEQGVAVLLIDDDPRVVEQLTRTLKRLGVSSRAFGCTRELLDLINSHWFAEHRPVLVVDLIMPRLHGGGILGGLELLEKIQGSFGEQQLLVYSDYPCSEIEPRLQQMGVFELGSKPRLTAVGDNLDELTDFCERLASRILALLDDRGKVVAGQVAAQKAPQPEAGKKQQAPLQTVGFGTLNGILQELREAENNSQVMLLVLRFATEILDRAVLFSIDGQRLVGVGQFGYGEQGSSADEKIRRLRIPVEEAGFLRDVIDAGAARTGSLGSGLWDRHLRAELGLGISGRVFAGPLVRNGQATALLCGDGSPNEARESDRQVLELFLHQAGMVLEKLKLSEQLREMSSLLGKSPAC